MPEKSKRSNITKEHLDDAKALHAVMQGLHESQEAQHAVKANARLSGEVIAKPKKREKALAEYILRSQHFFESDNDRLRERSWNTAINALLVEPDNIPESYWKQQEQLARDNGRGDIHVDDYLKTEMAKQLRDAQRTGAESWANYLEQTGEQYPTWFKLYAWDGMSRLGVFDKKKGKYRKRDKGTVAPYPQLNPAVLAKVYQAVTEHHVDGYESEDERIAGLVKNGNFNNLYSAFLLETKAVLPTPENPEDVTGVWKEYTEDDIEEITRAAEGTTMVYSR